MPIDEPRWWYRPDDALARVLSPLGSLYGSLAIRRFSAATSYRSSLPVICIGNFTAGGTGKTPLTRAICALLARRGERPAVLTRGYKGSARGPHWVDPAHDTALLVGDEPLLLARDAATLVSRDRAAGARAIEATGKHTVIVMDDGLQNPGLAKDLVVAVVDARRGFGNRRVIPAGPLRAPLGFQFDLAHALVVNEGHGAGTGDASVIANLRAQFQGPVLATHVTASMLRNEIRGMPVVAFAGIVAPERFFDLLTTLGANVVERITFPDHHTFSQADGERLLRAAAAHQGVLMTTEKDFVRLQGATSILADLRQHLQVLQVALAFEAGAEVRLVSLIDATLAHRRDADAAARRGGSGVSD